MTSDEVCFLPATALAALIRERKISPVEVTDAILARAEKVNPALNLFAYPMASAARDAARAAEAAVMSGAKLGPLHGVPVTVKDNVPIAGLPLGNGSIAMKEFIPTSDAVVVQRIKAAGAVIIGKTTLPEFAHRILTDSPTYGVTRNPWSLAHTPGGSSGGASAALAAGVAPLAVGTDGGGSIRAPASNTGVSGIKATLGRIPFETIPDGFANYAFVGPMARTAADVALFLSVMAGPCPDDPYSLGVPALDLSAATPRSTLRIGWIEHFGRYRTDPEVAQLTGAMVASLQREGHEVETVADPCFNDIFETYVVIATTAHAARLSPVLEKWGDKLTASMRKSIARGARYSAVEWQRAHDRRTVLFRSVQRLFDRYDLLLTPTMTQPPAKLDADGSVESDMYAEHAAALYPFNLTGHPAASVPAGFTKSGLPVGLQIVGPWFAESRILKVAAELETIHRWNERWPPLVSPPGLPGC